MSTFKSYIVHCALNLKLSTSELDAAEIMDKTGNLKPQKSFFFFPVTLRLGSRNLLVRVESFWIWEILLCRFS